MRGTRDKVREKPKPGGEQGFMLLGLIVAIFLILLALSVAAPVMGRNLRRERDVETVRRGNDYVRGIREYYLKTGRYPATMEQLEKTNNIRFLRKQYIDPITGKADWRTIPVGQNKTSVKGFFGQPLAGIATTGLGSVAGMASPGIGQTPASGPGGVAGAIGAPGAGGLTGGIGGTGSTQSSGVGTGGIASQSATTFTGSSQPFMGVGLSTTGDSIVEPNEQTSYDAWEFLYDPRIEQLKAKAASNTAVGSVGANSSGINPIAGPGANGVGGTGTPSSPVPAAPVFGAPVQP